LKELNSKENPLKNPEVRKLKMGIIGIPIIVGKKNNKTREFFKSGLTDGLRTRIIEFVSSNCQKNGIRVDILDLKELVDESKDSCFELDDLAGISRTSLDNLAEEFKKRINGLDFVTVIGGIHTGAYLLYHLTENVERYDIHEDNNDIDLIFHTSYMKHAIELKKSLHISNHGWQDLLGDIFVIKSIENLGKIFDIDVDYYTSTEYCRMTEERTTTNFQNVVLAIRKAKPKILGIFEYQTLDGSKDGYERLQTLVWEGIMSNNFIK
jgi:hypothetical protein